MIGPHAAALQLEQLLLSEPLREQLGVKLLAVKAGLAARAAFVQSLNCLNRLILRNVLNRSLKVLVCTIQ